MSTVAINHEEAIDRVTTNVMVFRVLYLLVIGATLAAFAVFMQFVALAPWDLLRVDAAYLAFLWSSFLLVALLALVLSSVGNRLDSEQKRLEMHKRNQAELARSQRQIDNDQWG